MCDSSNPSVKPKAVKPLHPWRRRQTFWAFPAWKLKHPEEARRVEARFKRENPGR